MFAAPLANVETASFLIVRTCIGKFSKYYLRTEKLHNIFCECRPKNGKMRSSNWVSFLFFCARLCVICIKSLRRISGGK